MDEAAAALHLARRHGIQYHISLTEVTEDARAIRELGLDPVDAVMIGGVCNGKAIDRHLFSFEPTRQRIVIEPPVYSKGYPYRHGVNSADTSSPAEPVGHYFPDMPAPLRAEVVVAMRPFDGRQHLHIIDAEISECSADVEIPGDSTVDLPPSAERSERHLYELGFDLSGLDGALLDSVGIAVYWPYHGTDHFWIFGKGTASAHAESTREAMRRAAMRALRPWTVANGGTFPVAEVPAIRFGDECFYITSHLNSPACSYPLWDFSEEGIRAYERAAGRDSHYPRTWGFPEIYGPEPYARWQYNLHQACSELCGVAREILAEQAPGVQLFRNTTRMGIFDLCNEHDGSGQELLTRNLDFVHLDPYPVRAEGYTPEIPRDMSYCAGLARRYGRALVPWLQAHVYGGPGGLQHVSADDVRRMTDEHRKQGVDAVIWLGYGPRNTFPAINPEAWAQAAAFHEELNRAPLPKPEVKLAVLRPYLTRAQLSLCGDEYRNPADWYLQQFLEVWAVEEDQPYDVFEFSVEEWQHAERITEQVADYPFVVSSVAFTGAWNVADRVPPAVSTDQAAEVRAAFRKQVRERGWLDA